MMKDAYKDEYNIGSLDEPEWTGISAGVAEKAKDGTIDECV